MFWVSDWSTRNRAVTGACPAGVAPRKATKLVNAASRARMWSLVGSKLDGPPNQVRRAAAGRAVSRVLFPALARLGWSSVWDGRCRPPRAAYPRLMLHGVGHTSPLIWPCSDWGLPCRRRYRPRGGLLPHRFTLTHRLPDGRFVFCGPVRRLSAPRRYLAVYPVELGLSSRRPEALATITLGQRGGI